MASGAPASDIRGAFSRGASMASQRSACGPRRSLRLLIGVVRARVKTCDGEGQQKKRPQSEAVLRAVTT